MYVIRSLIFLFIFLQLINICNINISKTRFTKPSRFLRYSVHWNSSQLTIYTGYDVTAIIRQWSLKALCNISETVATMGNYVTNLCSTIINHRHAGVLKNLLVSDGHLETNPGPTPKKTNRSRQTNKAKNTAKRRKINLKADDTDEAPLTAENFSKQTTMTEQECLPGPSHGTDENESDMIFENSLEHGLETFETMDSSLTTQTPTQAQTQYEIDEIDEVFHVTTTPSPLPAIQQTPEPAPKCLGTIHEGKCCQYCGAWRFTDERASFCCLNGSLTSIPFPKPPPDEIKALYDNQGFLNHIRSYNNVLALASLGCEEIRRDGFSPMLMVHGKIHHFIGSLVPKPTETPKYAQLYFYDPKNELKNRASLHPGLDTDILGTLQDCLHRINPYVQRIKSASEIYSTDNAVYEVVLKSDGSKTTELPTSSEVAGLVDLKSPGRVDVVFETTAGQIRSINELSKLYDPLHYVILFPFGDGGYHTGMFNKQKRKISIGKYVRYLLQLRPGNPGSDLLLRSRRLLQQYVIDQFAKLECYRMAWYRSHQKEIRAEKYNGLIDAVSSNDTNRPGKRIILPPTHYGSPRWYAECFQESMAIVRKYGKPDLFVTFTCNPKWPEITGSLFPNENPVDRPDISCRVFYLKNELLMKLLVKEHVLGRVIAYVAMKEDQKRGLPHFHILLTLDKDSKPRCPEDVDRIICAEIPDQLINPQLFKIITTNNIHGPCGDINKDARCQSAEKDGSCGRKFPKKFNNTGTTFSTNGYPIYLRRDTLHGGNVTYRTVKGKTYTIDNRWIVPYNPLLSYFFNAHINVEVVTTVGCVKYIFKYITKGSDKILYAIQRIDADGIDEIWNYSTARFISASEAFWRMFEFDVYKRYPPVMKLAVHLPDEQVVVFERDNADEKLADGPPITTLTAFFELNQNDPDATSILYPEICQHYRFSGKKWIKRIRQRANNAANTNACSDMIGRLPIIALSPKQAELYYMRMLLHQIPGPTSFENLRTINGQEFSTFREACESLGLLSSDAELDKAVDEVASVRFGDDLRALFATLLVYGECSNTLSFWEKHKYQLSIDIAHKYKRDEPSEDDYGRALRQLDLYVKEFDMNLEKDFQIKVPSADNKQPDEQTETTDDSYHTVFLSQLHTSNFKMMNEEQRSIFKTILSSIDNENGHCFSINAAGGTGKTFLVTTLLAVVRSRSQVAVATAVSGIAATLLPLGRTLHSSLKVPIDLDEYSTCNIYNQSCTAEKLRQCRLLIVDEVTMAHRYIFEAIDRSLQDLRQCNRMFGGVTTILSGDWRQILPVVKHGSEPEIIDACLKNSYIWKAIQKVSMTKNMRLSSSNPENEEFAKYLISVGEGKIPPVNSDEPDMIPIPEDLRLDENNLESLCGFVFEDMKNHMSSADWMCSRTVMGPTNEAADEVNTLMNKELPGGSTFARSADSLIDDNLMTQYPVEYLNSITPSGMPNHCLELKVGAPIMLLRNLDPVNHHCNGTRYIITQIHKHVIEATIASGVKAGTRRFIPRIPLRSTDKSLPFQMKRVQYPIKVCFGMTINKGQGQSLKRVGIYLKREVFSHGQLYVALSRVEDSKNIKVLPCSKDKPVMKNVVYKSIID